MNEKSVKNIVVISDTHCGCRFGLCPPEVLLDDEVKYQASKLQLKVWEHWKFFWEEWIPKVTKGEPYYIVHNGDVLDGVHHNSVTQLTHNINEQREIAIQVLEPIVKNKKVAGYYQIRGTESHVGKSGQDEEAIAKVLGAKKDKRGNYARWEMWLRFGEKKTLIHFTHHVGTSSSASYESTAVYKELIEAYTEAGRQRKDPPDVIVRSHRHRSFEIRIPTQHGYGISLVTPAWQLKTPYTYRFGLGRSSTAQIGGILIREGDEDAIYTRSLVWSTEREPEEIA